MTRTFGVAFVMMLLGAFGGYAKTAPPGWCQQVALAPSDGRICSSERLAMLDMMLAGTYARAVADSTVFAASIGRVHNEWLKSRNACGADEPCLEREYRDQILFLRTFYRDVRRVAN